MAATPVWSAAHNGVIGDASATAASALVNQFLVTHPMNAAYQGNPVLTPNGTGATPWAAQLSTQDIDQPFTMSGTSIGRVVIPLLPVGNGADLLVSLCTDSSGAPASVITQTRIPASWIYQLSAVSSPSVPSSQTPAPEYTGNPLATGQFNTLAVGPAVNVPWPTPAASGTANLITPAVAVGGNYMLFAGGINASTSALQASVFAVGWDGAEGLSAAIPQPSLPAAQVNGALALTSDTAVYAGGGTGGTYTSAVYTASWNANTGTLGAWSAQTALPTATQPGGAAVNGETVYLVGAGEDGSTLPSGQSVYYATVSNGQITSWATGPALPIAISQPNVMVCGGFLVIAGGINASSGALENVYYAPINADGSLKAWRPGPPLPGFCFNANNAAQNVSVTGGVMVSNQSKFIAMGADGSGLTTWSTQSSPNPASNTAWAAFPTADGMWQLFTMLPPVTANSYYTLPLYQQPMISVPLPTTGLANGTTYHILMQQPGGDLNNYLRLSTDVNVFPGNPTMLASPAGSYTWTPATTGNAVPLQVYDLSGPAARGLPPVHAWEDNGAQILTLVTTTTPDLAPTGFCEATRQTVATNSNQGFETTLSPWTVSGGTAVRSSTQAYEGQWSARITPNGTSANVFIESELIPCMPGQAVTVSGWMWFTNAVTSNASMSINWYTLAGTYLSTSTGTLFSVSAATWTNLTNTFNAPATAYGYRIVPTLGGTPAAAQVWYVDNAFSTDLVTPQNATVTQLEYNAAWPTSPLLLTALTELA